MEYPQVEVQINILPKIIVLHWEVRESWDCFRNECQVDGDPCWQDSCVELFIQDIEHPQLYRNFEWNSQGICLAAIGADRHERSSLVPNLKPMFRKGTIIEKRKTHYCRV